MVNALLSSIYSDIFFLIRNILCKNKGNFILILAQFWQNIDQQYLDGLDLLK